MKKLDRKTAVALSIFFALIMAYVWNVSMKNQASTARAREVPLVPVAVAAKDINPRTVIRPGMVRFEEKRQDQLPEGALRTTNDIYDKVALRTIPAGTFVTANAVATKGPNLGMSYNLPDNMRAVAVPLDQVSGVAGFLKPGDHVDVLATYTGNGVDATRTVLQDIELLAIGNRPINTTQYQGNNDPAVRGGQDPNQAQADAPTATLAVWPDQAQALVLAAAKARIHLALRSPDDMAPTPLKPATSATVFGIQPQRQASAPAAAPAPAAQVSAPAPPPPAIRETTPPPVYTPRPPKPPVEDRPAPKEDDTVTVIRGTEQTQVNTSK